MFINYSNKLKEKPSYNGPLQRLHRSSTSLKSMMEIDYYQSLQVASDFITENAIDNNNFPIDKDIFYAKYVDYCKDFHNVSPASKRNLTIYLSVLLAHHGYMLLNTKIPGRSKGMLTRMKNGERPRRK